ncbi:MAG: hypothetical protein ACK2U3_10255, partial [Anaerolineales bacterium]
ALPLVLLWWAFRQVPFEQIWEALQQLSALHVIVWLLVNVGLVMMSVGIILFALFPSLRVLSGINQFRHNHEIINLIIAVIVLIELTAGVLLIFVMKGVRT